MTELLRLKLAEERAARGDDPVALVVEGPDVRQWQLGADHKDAHAFIQWKGTDVCMDFTCDCGEGGHFDGFFAYAVRCPGCGTVWEMPLHVFPRKAERPEELGSVVGFERDDEEEPG